MNFYNEKYLFKEFIKDSNKYNKYYNNLMSFNKLPVLGKSQSSIDLFQSRIKDDNKNYSIDNYKHINNMNNNNLMYKPIKRQYNMKNLYNRMISLKMNLKPMTKRNLIYEDILNRSNSIFTSKFHRNVSLKPLKKICSFKSLILTPNQQNNKIKIKINFFNDYEKEFFPDIDYSNLKYNEYEIYNNKTVYENLIKEKINYFKKNNNENTTIKLEKNFHYGKSKKEINLSLDSIIISFKDMSLPNDIQENCFKIYFPLALLPIFYYKGFEAFIRFLSAVIRVENNFEKIYFKEDKVIEALNDIQDYQMKTEEEEEQNKEDKSDFYFDLNEKKPIEIKPQSLKKNTDFLKFNNFIFFWVTNTKSYIITITLPCIHLNIVENKIIINHFIDFELLFFLYKRNFLNWEYYIVKYLSGYSKFRSIFQQLGSVSHLFDKQFILKEPKTRINTFAEEKLVNVYTDQFNNNIILYFESFYVIVNYLNLSNFEEKTYHILFNFYQYLKLYRIAKYSNKILFLIKFLEINTELNTLNFNYNEYDNFDIRNWMSNLKKFSDGSLKNVELNEDLYGEFDIFSKKIKIEFRKPKWSIIKLENRNEIMKTWEIGNDLEEDLVECLVESSTDTWTNFLNNCLKKLNEPVPVLPGLNLKKRKKRGNRSNNSSATSQRKSRTKSNFSRY